MGFIFRGRDDVDGGLRIIVYERLRVFSGSFGAVWVLYFFSIVVGLFYLGLDRSFLIFCVEVLFRVI